MVVRLLLDPVADRLVEVEVGNVCPGCDRPIGMIEAGSGHGPVLEGRECVLGEPPFWWG